MGISNEPRKVGVGESDDLSGLLRWLEGESSPEEKKHFDNQSKRIREEYLNSKKNKGINSNTESTQGKFTETLEEKNSLYNIYLGEFLIDSHYQDIYFDKVNSKIDKNQATIILKFGVKKQEHHKICLFYNIELQNSATGSLQTNIVDTSSIEFSSISKKIGNGWKKKFIDYGNIRPVILQILNDYKYNNNLELKSY